MTRCISSTPKVSASCSQVRSRSGTALTMPRIATFSTRTVAMAFSSVGHVSSDELEQIGYRLGELHPLARQHDAEQAVAGRDVAHDRERVPRNRQLLEVLAARDRAGRQIEDVVERCVELRLGHTSG